MIIHGSTCSSSCVGKRTLTQNEPCTGACFLDGIGVFSVRTFGQFWTVGHSCPMLDTAVHLQSKIGQLSLGCHSCPILDNFLDNVFP